MSAFSWIIDQWPTEAEAEEIIYGIELKERGYTTCQCPLKQVEVHEVDEIFIVRAFGKSKRDRFIRAADLEEGRIFALEKGFRPAAGFYKWLKREELRLSK